MESSKNKYTETVKLSPQTNGPYSQKITPLAIVMHDTGGNYLGSVDWTSRIYNPETKQRLYAGVAHLHGLSPRARAMAIARVAHPMWRDALMAQAQVLDL